jgi:hypothetical protein
MKGLRYTARRCISCAGFLGKKVDCRPWISRAAKYLNFSIGIRRIAYYLGI